VIETLQKCLAGKLDEILEASPIGCEHREVITRFALAARTFLEAASRRDIRLVTDNWIDPSAATRLIKLESAVQISVVRDRQRVHSQLFRPRDQLINRTGSIEQTVMAVAMQMSKWRRRHRGTLP
jgi:hypothetical protein